MINLIGSLNGFLGPNYYRFRGIPIVKSESYVEILFIIINATLFLIHFVFAYLLLSSTNLLAQSVGQ